MRILVADDDPIQRHRLETAISGWSYDVTCVPDGERAWEALRDQSRYSILITDWTMPNLDGTDLCRRLRAERRLRYLPIILLTSRHNEKDMIEGINAGADAFISKPFIPSQLLAQIQVANRILDLEERLAGQLEEVRLSNERLENDLVAAAAVQCSLLPQVSPKIRGVNFSWVYEACERIGGDMFNFFRLDETHVGMYVLDVSGHGTSAALQSVSLSHVITPFDQQGGVLKRADGRAGRYELASPAEVARHLNQRFQMIEKSGQFFTFLYGVIDVPTRSLRYVSAGHPGPIVVSTDGARSYDKSGGIPVGIASNAAYEEGQIQLGAGDKLVFYTDGVLEARNAMGEEFGLERLMRTLSTAGGDIAHTVRTLESRLGDFAGDVPQRDDVTIVGAHLI